MQGLEGIPLQKDHAQQVHGCRHGTSKKSVQSYMWDLHSSISNPCPNPCPNTCPDPSAHAAAHTKAYQVRLESAAHHHHHNYQKVRIWSAPRFESCVKADTFVANSQATQVLQSFSLSFFQLRISKAQKLFW